MLLRVGCRFDYDADQPVAAVVLVAPRADAPAVLLREGWSFEPEAAFHEYLDLYGNRCRRVALGAGASSFTYDATLELRREPEQMPQAADAQHRVEDLPAGLLHWLLPSRYCESDVLGQRAWELFGATAPGAGRVRAVCDWIHGNIEYGVASLPTTTAVEIFERRGGVCRDLAHLGVTLCRALGIPARYVFGYMPDIDIPGPYPTMDFHAWFEVWLGDRWWTHDARFNVPRIGRLPIGHGRDAVDVAMVTTYGVARLERMSVWSDELAGTEAPRASGATVEVPRVR